MKIWVKYIGGAWDEPAVNVTFWTSKPSEELLYTIKEIETDTDENVDIT